MISAFSNYACPLCAQSLLNLEKYWKEMDSEIANTQMPDEYKNFIVSVLCRDCHKVGDFSALFLILILSIPS